MPTQNEIGRMSDQLLRNFLRTVDDSTLEWAWASGERDIRESEALEMNRLLPDGRYEW